MKQSLMCLAAVCLVAGSVLAVDPMGAEMVPSLPGGLGTTAYGVNMNGWVVGQADNFAGQMVGFVYTGGTTVELPMLPNGTSAQAQGINNNGVIVGLCYIPNPLNPDFTISRAVKWEKINDVWTVTDLGTLRDDNSGFGVAQRINDAGVVVGYTTRQGGNSYHGTVWHTDGTKTDVGTLNFVGNFAYSQALGLNQAGDVSGYAYATLQGPEHGLFYTASNGRTTDLTPPGQFGLAQWHQVNDDGKLGGYVSGSTTGGEFRPATCVPGSGIELVPMLEGLEGGYGYDLNNGSVLVGVMFHLEADPTLSVFRAFMSVNGETTDLNTIATGVTGTLIEARGVTNNGLIVATADGGMGTTQAVLLYPMPPGCAGDMGQAGGAPGSDGMLDNNDFIAFINYFFNHDRHADVGIAGGQFGSDGMYDNNDFIAFINLFFTGCN
ncbi:MAG: GC-type dockerin domain-anchored protein [Phycisphaerales bacterium]